MMLSDCLTSFSLTRACSASAVPLSPETVVYLSSLDLNHLAISLGGCWCGKSTSVTVAGDGGGEYSDKAGEGSNLNHVD